MGRAKDEWTEYELAIEESYNGGMEPCGCDNTIGYRDKCFIHGNGLEEKFERRNRLESLLIKLSRAKADYELSHHKKPDIEIAESFRDEIIETLKDKKSWSGKEIKDYSKDNLSPQELLKKVYEEIAEQNKILNNHLFKI